MPFVGKTTTKTVAGVTPYIHEDRGQFFILDSARHTQESTTIVPLRWASVYNAQPIRHETLEDAEQFIADHADPEPGDDPLDASMIKPNWHRAQHEARESIRQADAAVDRAGKAAIDRLNGKTPWEFACAWYTPDAIRRHIDHQRKPITFSLGGEVRVPDDIYSTEFADWLAHQYRLAMQKGIEIGLRA